MGLTHNFASSIGGISDRVGCSIFPQVLVKLLIILLLDCIVGAAILNRRCGNSDRNPNTGVNAANLIITVRYGLR